MKGVLILTFFLLLIFLFRLFSLPAIKAYSVNQKVSLITTLSGEPQVSSRSQRFTTPSGLTVVTDRYPEYHYGDNLKITGIIKKALLSPSSQHKILPNFKQSDLELVFPEIELTGKGEINPFLEKILLLRKTLVKNYQEFLPEPAASLLTGITLGVKTQTAADFKESLRKVGLTHVVVASGMNVTLVAGFLSGILMFFFRRQIALLLVILGIFFYALLAGFEAPIVRAAIMGSLAFLAQAIGRQNWAALGLILSGFIMLLVSPLLIFDLGFQLSFLATSGLLFVKPVLEKARPFNFLAKIPLLGESFSTTLAAQLATLPLIITTFGYYSLLSLLSNVLVLWTTPYIMGIGGLAAVFGLFFKPLGQLLTWLAYPFLFYFEKMTFFFSQFDFLSWEVNQGLSFFSLSYFSFLIAILGLMAIRRADERTGK